VRLRVLRVHEGNTYLPFFFTYPKLMERAQARKDTAAEPTAITSLSWVPGGMNFSLENDETLYLPSNSLYRPTWLNILFNSLFNLSARPENKLPPPPSTTLLSKTWRMSGSHEVTEALISWGRDFGRLGFVACVKPLNKPDGVYQNFVERILACRCWGCTKKSSPTSNLSGPK